MKNEIFLFLMPFNFHTTPITYFNLSFICYLAMSLKILNGKLG